MSTQDSIARLRRLDACAVSDALDQLGLTPAVTGIAALTVRRRVCGRVVTVRLSEGPAPSGATSHLGTIAIERAAAGEVIVVEQRTGLDAAGWGGILSNAAHLRGVEGVIVEGPARDIDEAAELGFPVFARSATARTARGRVHEAATGAPVRVGDAVVETGDVVVADSSGVAFIPAGAVEAVLAAAERIARREAVLTDAIRAGGLPSHVMGANYEQMLEGAAATLEEQ